LNPIPAGDAGRAVVDIGRAAGDSARRERLVAKVEEMVELRFAGTRELQSKGAIAERSLICES